MKVRMELKGDTRTVEERGEHGWTLKVMHETAVCELWQSNDSSMYSQYSRRRVRVAQYEVDH